MGTYVNPRNTLFRMARNSEIYVDKSGIIGLLNRRAETEARFVCMSRPRRFGKTLTGNMLCAYYGSGEDSRALFDGLKITDDPSFEQHVGAYNVVCINMQQMMSDSDGVEDMLDLIETEVCADLQGDFPNVRFPIRPGLSRSLQAVSDQTGKSFVFVIDEWDCLMRARRDDQAAQKTYLDWLRNLLKDRAYVALAYMTGILPIKKYGEHSALNMFDEISMTNAWPFQGYTGFTDDEVDAICARYGTPVDTMREWYDGYTVNDVHVYNPKSVVSAAPGGVFDNYWTKTETFDALRMYIEMDMDGLHEKVVRLVAGESVAVDTTSFVNDMTTFASADDVLTLLVHLGYLTYQHDEGTVRIPNLEVAEQFRSCVTNDRWGEVARSIRESSRLVRATLAGDAEQVGDLVAQTHRDAASLLRYNDENSLACALSLAYYAARQTHVIRRELAGGVGFADLVFLPRKGRDVPAMVIELKWNRDARGALAQIAERGYVEGVRGLAGEAVLVGISYRKDDPAKAHECVIERRVLG